MDKHKKLHKPLMKPYMLLVKVRCRPLSPSHSPSRRELRGFAVSGGGCFGGSRLDPLEWIHGATGAGHEVRPEVRIAGRLDEVVFVPGFVHFLVCFFICVFLLKTFTKSSFRGSFVILVVRSFVSKS